ncbi:MAG: hypothetical protein ACAI44_14885 [Candidatus Sericytochromatia bacterium]
MANLGSVNGNQQIRIADTPALRSTSNTGYIVDASSTQSAVFSQQVRVNGQTAFVSPEGLSRLKAAAAEDSGARTEVGTGEDGVPTFNDNVNGGGGGGVTLQNDPTGVINWVKGKLDAYTNIEDQT